MTRSAFQNRLNAAMVRAGLKQADLVRMAAERGQKLGKSQVSQYVSGKVSPRRDVLALLADLLGVTEAWLSGAEPDAEVDGSVDVAAGSTASAAAPAAASSTVAPSTSPSAAAPSAAVPSAAGTAAALGPTTSSHPQPTTQRSTTMREFKKSSKLDNVLYDVRGPVVDEAARMEEDGARILKLNIGNPAPFGFRAPDEVVFDMRQQLADCEGYSDSRGLFAARKAIMQYAQLRNIPNVDMKHI